MPAYRGSSMTQVTFARMLKPIWMTTLNIQLIMSTSLAAEIANILNGLDLEHLREIGFKTKIKVRKEK